MTYLKVSRTVQEFLSTKDKLLWSLFDQALVSGANVLTSVLIVRSLGLGSFGDFSLVTIIIQSLASAQIALVIAPMMTNYERKDRIDAKVYLSTVLIHQCACLVISIAFLLALNVLTISLGGQPFWNVPTHIITLAIISTQCQDLIRRFCFVSGRSRHAVVSDGVAYLGRLLTLAVLSASGKLDLTTAWAAISICNGLACLVLLMDYRAIRFSRRAFWKITRSHGLIAGWMLGNAATQWLSGNLYLIAIGAVLGPEALGTVRAIQNIVGVTNVVLQSLENFVPAAATRAYLSGSKSALLRYALETIVIGALFFGVVIALGVIFINPIMHTIYGRTFEHQMSLFVCFGLFYGLGYVQFVFGAALRSLNRLGEAFWFQTVISITALPVGWLMGAQWGALGAACALLLPRAAIVLRLWFVLWPKKQ